MSRTIHYRTVHNLTPCGLSLPREIVIGGERYLVGACNSHRVRHGNLFTTSSVDKVTCKNCMRAMRK